MFIYKITNNINNKIYIGQTVRSLKERFLQHQASCNAKNSAISNAIQKYGKENFIIEEIDGANSLSELNYLEWLYIHKFNCISPNGYNLKEGGGSKGALCQKIINKINKTLKGRKITPKQARKHKNAMARRMKIFGPNKKSMEALDKSREKQKRPIKCKITGKVFNSVSEASRYLNTATSSICKNLKNKTNSVKGCDFVYLDQIEEKIKLPSKQGRKRIYFCQKNHTYIYGDKELSLYLNINVYTIHNRARNINKLKDFINRYNIKIVH